MTFEELLARKAIRDTLATYNIMGDRGLIEAYAATFTEDGVLEMPPAIVTGRAEIVRFVNEVGIPALNARLTGEPVPLRHNITTSRIELAGTDSARVTTYFLLLRAGRIEESGIYLDRFARVGDAWFIAHRRIKMEFVLDSRPNRIWVGIHAPPKPDRASTALAAELRKRTSGRWHTPPELLQWS